jgi:hypothetical protein
MHTEQPHPGPNDPAALGSPPDRMVGMRERSRWMLLTTTLIIALGGGLAIGLFKLTEQQAQITRQQQQIIDVQHDQDRDMCDMIAAVIPSDAPPPTTERGVRQAEAIEHYRQRRC